MRGDFIKACKPDITLGHHVIDQLRDLMPARQPAREERMPDRYEKPSVLPRRVELGLEHFDRPLRRLNRHLKIQIDAVHILRPVIQSPARRQLHQIANR
ncbi:hypothetical protein D3C76_1440760 [compost metagenome]